MKNISRDELIARWNQRFLDAQAANEADKRGYSHGAFVLEPETGA